MGPNQQFGKHCCRLLGKEESLPCLHSQSRLRLLSLIRSQADKAVAMPLTGQPDTILFRDCIFYKLCWPKMTSEILCIYLPLGGKLLMTLTAASNLSWVKRLSSSTRTLSTSIVSRAGTVNSKPSKQVNKQQLRCHKQISPPFECQK